MVTRLNFDQSVGKDPEPGYDGGAELGLIARGQSACATEALAECRMVQHDATILRHSLRKVKDGISQIKVWRAFDLPK